MSSLVSCDLYSLEIILSYLSGGSILSLVMSGSPTLSAKVLSTCKRLVLRWSGLGRARWPSLLHHFGQLTEFGYSNAKDIRWLPCRDVKLSQLPNTLRSLSLAYFNPFSSLNNTITDYATQFPHLSTLEIRSKVALAPFEFALFPASLTHLKVKCKDYFKDLAMLPYLSSGLKHLSIGAVLVGNEEEHWKHFPTNLESLHLSCDRMNPDWAKHFPPTLTSLRVTITEDQEGEYRRMWPFLPKQLKFLHFDGSAELAAPIVWSDFDSDLKLYRQLPRSIETMIWSAYMPPPTAEDSETYDARIESIFSSGPASLKRLEYDGMQFCAKTLEACPWRLREANIRNASDLSEKSLPALSMGVFASLTELHILKGALTVEVAEALPTTIYSLTIQGVTNSVAVALGKRLVSLRRLACETGSLSASGVSGLPQSITTLIVGHAVLESIECLKELSKKSLQSLSFYTVAFGDSTVGMIEDPEASFWIPPSVTKLSLYVPDRLSKTWFKGLALHPSLEELRVSYFIEVPSYVLSYMPKTIRSISMNVKDLDGKSLKSLPPSVRCLSLCGRHDIHLNNKDLASIPENTYSISISHSKNLTKDAGKFVPKNVFELLLNWSEPTWFSHNFNSLPKSRPKSSAK